MKILKTGDRTGVFRAKIAITGDGSVGTMNGIESSATRIPYAVPGLLSPVAYVKATPIKFTVVFHFALMMFRG